MRRIEIEGCMVDILPIVKGLASDGEKVVLALRNEYDSVGVALGPEDIIAFAKRDEIMGDEGPEITDLETVYSHFLMKFGKIDFPTPAYSALVDECGRCSIPLIPLDMDDETYSDVYCDTITTMELLKETRLAKKALKKGFSSLTPEDFAVEWDDYINRIRGFQILSGEREGFIADSIRRAARKKNSMLAVIEIERVEGIVEMLTGDSIDL